MTDLIEFIDQFLRDIFEPYGVEVFYKDAEGEKVPFPYVVYTSESDPISRIREDFIFTVNIWGTSKEYQMQDETSELIKKAVNNGTFISRCAPMTIAVDFAGRGDIPVEDQNIRLKEVRFRVRYYNM
ncbi:hypothetical protein [Bacillus multifaciens]|uniref:hypothetical protein n=1 Tax=Bacillus multifaciens TaxID=3068506 RepID=UPI0027416DC9|nr:hypothetical protein [Bacillus sp. WLY-B-L8]MDP7981035.1 hypothetical protein [Bacillus sp. WLY-B-L8]